MKHAPFLALSALLLMLPAAARAVEQAPAPPQAPAAKSYPVVCPCGSGCDCGGTCGCLTTGGCSRTCSYACAYRQAVKEHRPLVVWVSFNCPTCEADLTDCVHCHTATWPVRSSEDAPRVLVSRPDGAGGLDCCDTLTGAVSSDRIRGALRTPVAAQGASGWQRPAFALGGAFGGVPASFAGGSGGCASCGGGGGGRRR